MATVVPSQIVQYIDKSFSEEEKRGLRPISLDPSRCGPLSALIILIQQVPSALWPSDPELYPLVVQSVEEIKSSLKMAESQDENSKFVHGYQRLGPSRPQQASPVGIIRDAFAQCSDDIVPWKGARKEMETTDKIIKGIDQLRAELAGLRESSLHDEDLWQAKLKTWTKRAYEQLKEWGLSAEADQGFGGSSISNMYPSVEQGKWRDKLLIALRDDMASHPAHYESKLTSAKQLGSVSAKPMPTKPHKIFLGHGRSKLWARVHMHLKDELELNVEAWESEPRAGKDSVAVLKALLASCTFAVIVATGEDTTAAGEPRARQNVVHEIGLFQGRIGFDKVALLQQDGIEGLSNLAGLQTVPFAGDRIEAAFYELGRMLKREGIIK